MSKQSGNEWPGQGGGCGKCAWAKYEQTVRGRCVRPWVMAEALKSQGVDLGSIYVFDRKVKAVGPVRLANLLATSSNAFLLTRLSRISLSSLLSPLLSSLLPSLNPGLLSETTAYDVPSSACHPPITRRSVTAPRTCGPSTRRGRAVHVVPMKSMSKVPGTKCLNLKYSGLLSSLLSVSNCAATSGDSTDPFLEEVSRRVLDRLLDVKRDFKRVLVLGGAGDAVVRRLLVRPGIDIAHHVKDIARHVIFTHLNPH